MTAVVFMSLSCLLAALVLRINTLQDELDASRDPCQIVGGQDGTPSLEMESSILITQGLTESSVNEEFTTFVSTLKFGQRPDIIWSLI